MSLISRRLFASQEARLRGPFGDTPSKRLFASNLPENHAFAACKRMNIELTILKKKSKKSGKLKLMCVFIEDCSFRCPPVCLSKSPKVSANLAMCRPW